MEYHHKKLDQKNGDNLELHPQKPDMVSLFITSHRRTYSEDVNTIFYKILISLCTYNKGESYYEISEPCYLNIKEGGYELSELENINNVLRSRVRLICGKLYQVSSRDKQSKWYKEQQYTDEHGTWKTTYLSDTTRQRSYFFVQRCHDKEGKFDKDKIRIVSSGSKKNSHLEHIYNSISDYPFRMLGKD